MTTTDKARLATLVAGMASMYGREIGAAGLEAYWIALRDLAIGDIERAAAEAMRTAKFMPTAAELRELAGAGGQRLEDRAALAFEDVARAVQRHGYYDTVKFEDPVTNATLRALWVNWMGVDDAFEKEDRKWLRKNFIDAYCVHARAGTRDTMPLLGYFEAENSRTAQPHTRPVLAIGVSGEVKRLASPNVPLRLEGPIGEADLTGEIGRMPT